MVDLIVASLPSDKALHAAGGVVIGCEVEQILPERFLRDRPVASRAVAYVLVAVVGIGKEVYDHQHPDQHSCEWQDAAASIAGGAIGVEVGRYLHLSLAPRLERGGGAIAVALAW